MDAKDKKDNNSDNKTNAANPPTPEAKAQWEQPNLIIASNNEGTMSRANKVRLWIGISFIIIVVLFVLTTVIIPSTIARNEPCNMFSSYGDIKLCSFGGIYVWGLVGSFFVGIPLTIIGLSLILYSILSWKKVKKPGVITLLITFLLIAITALTIFLALYYMRQIFLFETK